MHFDVCLWKIPKLWIWTVSCIWFFQWYTFYLSSGEKETDAGEGAANRLRDKQIFRDDRCLILQPHCECKTVWVWNGTGPPEDMGKWMTWILADVFCGWTCLQSHCLFDCQHHVSIRWPLISADWEGLVNRHNSNWTSWFPEICPAGQAINVHVYPSKPEGVFVPEGWQCLDCQVLLVHRCRWLALWLTQLKVQKSMNIDWCWK